MDINGSILLYMPSIYSCFDDFRFILINDIDNNNIHATSWLYGKETKLELRKQDNISKTELEEKENYLINNTWELADYTQNEKSHKGLGWFADGPYDSFLFLTDSYFQEKGISYKFYKDKSHQIFAGADCIFKGYWDFSRSGKFLKVREQSQVQESDGFTEKFLMIDQLNDKTLSFVKEEDLYVGDWEFIGYYISQQYILRDSLQ